MKIDHIGIAVKDIEKGISLYKKIFDKENIRRKVLRDRGLIIALFEFENFSVELISPISDNPVKKFLEKRGDGLHHIALKPENFNEFLNRVKELGIKIVDGPREGAFHSRVIFLDPKQTGRVLIEVVG